VTLAGLTGLAAVSCVGAADCTAVSSSGDVIEHWNGTTWSSSLAQTRPGTSDFILTSISCTGASNCMAVGSYVKKSSDQVNLAEHWNGTEWSIVRTPNR
jgi:hypothetical protein